MTTGGESAMVLWPLPNKMVLLTPKEAGEMNISRGHGAGK